VTVEPPLLKVHVLDRHNGSVIVWVSLVGDIETPHRGVPKSWKISVGSGLVCLPTVVATHQSVQTPWAKLREARERKWLLALWNSLSVSLKEVVNWNPRRKKRSQKEASPPVDRVFRTRNHISGQVWILYVQEDNRDSELV